MYEEFYHLSAKPFRLSPDPEFFFASRGHKRALAYLRYGLSQDEGFVVITGAPGTGKTTLAQILLKEMNESKVVVAQITTTMLEADEILRMVLGALDLPFEGRDKPALLKSLEEYLLAQSRENKRVLLVVDEAQNLPARSIEELRMLSNLQVGNKALLQTFLLGQTQFRNMLERPDLEQFRQRVIANYHLSELAEDECQQYIESRLAHVGWQNDPYFTGRAYEGIYQYTQGIPRRINMLCDRLMLFSFLEARHEIDEGVLREVTRELQQEISGTRVDTNDDSMGQDSMYADLHRHSVDDNAQNRNAFNKAEREENPAEVNFGENALGRVMPDEFYERLVSQGLVDDSGDDKAGSFGRFGASRASAHQGSKDRFHVISGGRNERQFSRGDQPEASSKPEQEAAEQTSPATNNQQPQDDSEEVVLRKILRLVLAYHRSPRSFPGLDDPTQPLPKGIHQILTLATSNDEVLRNLRQISVMGISPAMLRAAVRFFVRRVMFLPGGDDYRVLGLSPDATKEEMEEHYGLLIQIMRQEKHGHQDSGIARVREAYGHLTEAEAPEVDSEIAGKEASNTAGFGEELDIDLSPPGEDTGSTEVSTTRRPDQFSDFIAEQQLSSMISGDQRTAQTSRNIVLITGAVVVGFVLYLTQVSNTDVPDLGEGLQSPTATQPEMTSEQSTDNQTVAANPDDQAGESVSEETTTTSAVVEDDAEARRKRVLEELRAEAEAKANADRKAKDAETRAQAEAEQLARAEKERKAAEARARAAAAAKARAEAEAKKEAEERARLQVALQARLAEEAEARKAAEEQARAEAAVRAAEQAKADRIKELNAFVKDIENTYAAGNLEAFVALFANTVKTNDHTDVQGIRDDYRALFDSTSTRQLTIKNLKWQLEDTVARGIGNFEVVVRSIGKASNDVFAGTINLQVASNNGELLITTFLFSQAEAPPKVVATSSGSIASIEELREVLEDFAIAYRKGDINQFMALFTPDAKTNDDANPEAIRKDYSALFDSTRNRKIDFLGMQWQREGGISRGEGNYVVKVDSGSSGEANYRGKLWFTIRRHEGKLLISYFAFE